MTNSKKDTELREQIADVLMTPNQRWQGIKSVPIELIWGFESLIRQQVIEAEKRGYKKGVVNLAKARKELEEKQ